MKWSSVRGPVSIGAQDGGTARNMKMTLWEKFRPTGLLLLITGTFPYSGIVGASTPTFSVCTFPYLYCTGAFVILAYDSVYHFALLFDPEFIQSHMMQEGFGLFQTVVKSVLTTNLHLLSLFYHIYFLFFGRRVVSLFRVFDERLGSDSSGLPRWAPFSAAIVMMTLLLVRFLATDENFDPEHLYDALISFNGTTFTLLILAFSLELMKTLEAIEPDSHPQLIKRKYLDIWTLAGQIGETLSYPLMVTLFSVFLMIFAELYSMLSLMKSPDFSANPHNYIELAESIIILAQQSLCLLLLTCGSHWIQRKVDRLYKILLEREMLSPAKSSKDGAELKAYTDIIHNPLQKNLSGSAEFDRSSPIPVSPYLLSPHPKQTPSNPPVFQMLNAVVTYMVILLQFDTTIPPPESNSTSAPNSTPSTPSQLLTSFA
ncbi:unnamed protein product [Darwinula stevensoni]|uniref:Gustatory receptor n=1 Tax=Darwinula stevensoni TaxID=69355 RepID=A0A7R9ADT7_9CRUS|nr:unnamed protein product [Darwinula stevensoni]CAG0901073.1 unnamed protein product [Darwinula stevensoni]